MKEQTYRMDAGPLNGSLETLGEQRATTPNKALRLFFGEDLATSNGRSGRLTDGRYCIALLRHGGRTRYADERTNRLLRP